jgi:pimeloyl-ACP methyl ester carboxylesterase
VECRRRRDVQDVAAQGLRVHRRSGSRLEVLPGVGHFAQVEAPTKVVDLIEDFMATTRAAAVPSQQPRS